MPFYIGHYQSIVFNTNCINCQVLIKTDDDFGKYSRYISGKMLLFCGTDCSGNYENKLRLCSFCQKELCEDDSEVII